MISRISKNLTDSFIFKIYRPILAVIFVIILFWSGFNFFTSHSVDNTTANVRNLIITGLQNADELTAVSQVGKATIVIGQEKKLWKLPIGNTNLVYEGVGKIRAGFNFTDIAVQAVDNNNHSIRILLPPPSIQDISLDVSKSNTLANYRHWFAPKSNSELYEQAQRKAIASLKAEACENHILEAANTNAGQLIRHILTEAGFQTIQIDTQLPNDNTCPVS